MLEPPYTIALLAVIAACLATLAAWRALDHVVARANRKARRRYRNRISETEERADALAVELDQAKQLLDQAIQELAVRHLIDQGRLVHGNRARVRAASTGLETIIPKPRPAALLPAVDVTSCVTTNTHGRTLEGSNR